MRLIRVISSKDGGGTNSAHIEVVEWNDAFGSGAGEVGSGALMVTMVSAPAISARACVRAIATVVPWVLAVALETIWVGRKVFLPFAQH